MKEHKLEIGSFDTVLIEKMFGPTIMADVRITADTENVQWIIERKWIETGKWIKWCSIPGQIEEEFGVDATDV